MEKETETTLAVEVTEKNEKKLAKDKYTCDQQKNLLTMAFVGKQGKCAGYDDPLWIGGKPGIVGVVNDCAEELQSLLVQRKGDEGRVVMPDPTKFKRIDKLREKTFGIFATMPPKAIWRNSVIASKDMIANRECPDLKFYLKWRVDEEMGKLYVNGKFMEEEYELDDYTVGTDIAERILDVFQGEKSLQKFYEKHRDRLVKRERSKNLGRYSDYDGKIKAISTPAERLKVSDMGRKVATDFTPLNKRIREIVTEKLTLRWLPEEGEWAYSIDTKGGEVGVGTFLIIEKDD